VSPSIPFHAGAVVTGVAICLVLGLLWYGVLFGRVWPGVLGLKQPPAAGALVRSSVVNAISLGMLGTALAFGVAIWRPSTWGEGPDAPPQRYAFFAAAYGWIGYAVPALLGGVAFERRRWRVFLVDAVYRLVCMVIMALLTVFWA
jgi:hypothetical protein